MAALTAIAGLVSAAVAVGSYAQNRSAAKKQERAAQNQRIAASFESAANRQAATAAAEREQTAGVVRANEAQAAQQLDDTVDVTVANEEAAPTRRRRIQAQFNVGEGGATSSAGSIRV